MLGTLLQFEMQLESMVRSAEQLGNATDSIEVVKF